MSESARPRVLVVENDPQAPIGYLADALAAADVTTRTISGHQLPEYNTPLDHDAIVVLGGFMGAYDEDQHPWLTNQLDVIRQAIDRAVPVLGICLGAQMIASATGGRAYLADKPEVGVITPTLTDAGSADPLASHLTVPLITYHQDSFDLPGSAVLLAESDRFPLVFRQGSALGIQPHPEVSKARIAEWMRDSSLPERAGVSPQDLLTDIEERVMPEQALALFAAWIDEALG